MCVLYFHISMAVTNGVLTTRAAIMIHDRPLAFPFLFLTDRDDRVVEIAISRAYYAHRTGKVGKVGRVKPRAPLTHSPACSIIVISISKW